MWFFLPFFSSLRYFLCWRSYLRVLFHHMLQLCYYWMRRCIYEILCNPLVIDLYGFSKNLNLYDYCYYVFSTLCIFMIIVIMFFLPYVYDAFRDTSLLVLQTRSCLKCFMSWSYNLCIMSRPEPSTWVAYVMAAYHLG